MKPAASQGYSRLVRIAVVIHEFPPIGGGAATAAACAARALAEGGHRVMVVTAGGRNLPATDALDGVQVERLASLRLRALAPSKLELLSFCASALVSLERRIRRFAADGVLAYFAVPAGAIAVRVARNLKIPIVVSLRGSDVPGFSGGRLDGPLGRVAHPVIRRTLSRADVVAPNSEALRALALAFMPEIAPRIAVVPNGIESSLIAAEPAASGGPEIALVQVGQLIARKRVAATIDAVARLRASGVPVRLTVVGDGPLRGELERDVRDRDLGAHVELTGHRTRAEVLALLPRHDLFVMTSSAEGMSNALVEAMARGLPIVTTRNGSHDVVERAGCGRVLPVDDGAALVASLRELAGSAALRAELARAGIAHARTLTWTACAARFAELLASARGHRPA